MRSVIFLALCAVAAANAEQPDGDALKKEWAKLNGTWKLVKMEWNGKSMLKEGELRGMTMAIADGKVTDPQAREDDGSDITSVRLDPSAKPNRFTATYEAGYRTMLGIYALDGDDLKVCVTVVASAQAKEREKERPKEFNSKQGVFLVYKRIHK